MVLGMIFVDFYRIWNGYLGSLWDTISDLFVLGDGENAALVGSLLLEVSGWICWRIAMLGCGSNTINNESNSMSVVF